MKKTTLILLLLWIGTPLVHAQQKTVHHLIVTIYETYGIGGSRILIETRDDGSQTKRDIGMRQGITLSTVMRNEDTLMGALRPYFAAGWEISASTATMDASTSYYFTRFFLRKEDQDSR
jgi:hypothetical protein